MKSKNKKLLIIDGHNYLYRAYYGIPSAVRLPDNRQGNAVYGFFAFLRRMVNWTNPENIVVVFDSETGIKNKIDENASYKQNRKKPDVEMFDQLEIIKKLLKIVNITSIESPKHEADDIIGSLATNSMTKGTMNYISSSDHDFFQLISHNIKIAKEVRGKLFYINRSYLYRNHGITPHQYIDYLALKGDPSDNIRGVPGIGPKTAQKLIDEYENIPKILNSYNKLSDSIRLKLEENREILLNNRNFFKINTSISLSPWMNDVKSIPDIKTLESTTNEIIKKASAVLSDF